MGELAPNSTAALGQAGAGAEDDGLDMSIFTTVTPSFADVLEKEWEHHRYAARDLDAIEAMSGPAA